MGDPHRYPFSPPPVSANGDVSSAAPELGIEARVGPVAIANGRFGNRPHCIYRGFCLQGCKVNAKASPLITHVPDALAHGGEVRPNCMVTKIVLGSEGLATGSPTSKEASNISSGPGRWQLPATRSRLLDYSFSLRNPDSPTGCATTKGRSATI